MRALWMRKPWQLGRELENFRHQGWVAATSSVVFSATLLLWVVPTTILNSIFENLEFQMQITVTYCDISLLRRDKASRHKGIIVFGLVSFICWKVIFIFWLQTFNLFKNDILLKVQLSAKI